MKGKVGRPKAVSTLGKTLKIRLSDAELASVKVAAGEAGMTVSAFVRSLSLEGAGVRPIFNASDRAALSILYENMRKIGVNLNQVARAINSGRAVHPEEVAIALRNVELIATGVAVELRNSARRAGNARRET
nr:plasmid mobilization relaxosome protein MobC [Agrobacterium sp. LAD9]